MDALIRQRASIKAQITRIENFLQQPECTTADIKVRYAKIDDIIKQFDVVQTSIEQSVAEDKFEQELHARDELETRSLRVKAKMFEMLEEAAATVSSPFLGDEVSQTAIGNALESLANSQTALNGILEKLSTSTSQRETTVSRAVTKSSLPELAIPDFSGAFEDWIRFRDLFAAIIKCRKDLAGIEKMEYLQGRLKGEALSIIKHLPPSEENFETAWGLLCDRYNKTYLIVDAHLHKLFDQSPMKTGCLSDLKQFYFTTNEHYNALHVLKQPVLSWSRLLLYHLLKKVDNDSKLAWSRETRKIEEPNFQQFLTFLSERINEKEKIEDSTTTAQKTVVSKSPKQRTFAVSMPSCLKCKQSHSLYQCPAFKELSVALRNEFVRSNGICPNCLRTKHSVTECKFSNCRMCKGRHNTLLHETKSLVNAISVYSSTRPSTKIIILPTAIIMVKDSQNVLQPCRALLDSGSQSTLITESCAQRLNLPRLHARISISGIGQTNNCMTTRGKVMLNIYAANDTRISSFAYIVPTLTGELPQIKLTSSDTEFFKTINLADRYFDQPGPIEILLGVDVVFQALIDGQITHPSQTLIAKNTLFGWVVAGNTAAIDSPTDISVMQASVADLDSLVRSFWEQESLNDGDKSKGDAESLIEEHFRQHYIVRDDGRYMVSLPFNTNKSLLGQTRNIAMNRLLAMERRFRLDADFKSQYIAFMREYENLGHMTRIETLEDGSEMYFLPHHAVLKPSSTSTKLRVVFDASAKPATGYSLNECLLNGPVIQNDLFTILVRFRTFRVAVTADIAQMYRQILVNHRERRFQQIYWRESEDSNIGIYQLNTLTYGTTPASFLATRTLKQIALNKMKEHPDACSHLLEQFYMDDYIGGAHSLEAAKHIALELSDVLQSAGMKLCKWSSSCPKFIACIPPNDREISDKLFFGEKGAIKTLGMWWQTQPDVFRFRIQLNVISESSTKRDILSIIARIFDPLGWLSPTVVYLKIFMKRLWSTGIGWDDPIPQLLRSDWNAFRNGADDISGLSIRRWIQFEEDSHAELHVFADSSKLAYGAVVYMRVLDRQDNVHVSLVASKTRIAPTKASLSIPRLELCAALLAAQLIEKVSQAIAHFKIKHFGWSDSTAVLYWIKGYPRQRNIFVDNRISKIVSTLPASCWNYVPTTLNPADYITRGMNPRELLKLKLWWGGPEFMQQPMLRTWTIPHSSNEEVTDVLEVSTIINQTTLTEDFYTEYFARFSNFNRLVRVVARIKRLPKAERVGLLTPGEINEARLAVIRLAQHSMFETDIKNLNRGRPIHKRSNFYGLDAFFDEKGVIRNNGRLSAAMIPYEQAYPPILHYDHHFCKLLIRWIHIQNMHPGIRQTINLVSLTHHIIGCSRGVRRCIYSCPVCMRYRGASFKQKMGQLPPTRVQPSMPFVNTGIDYCGPITIRAWKGRGAKMHKAYIALFVCMSTKALHLEAVTELSTEAFIATLRRFVSRRGLCRNIFSDNGLNFVGANTYLRSVSNLRGTEDYQRAVINESSTLGINWHFSPPHSPHFGGLWEAGVKTVKFHLRRVMGVTSFTFEELSTVLCQIEACANSRPLCQRFEGDTDPLTPAHFLIMRSLKCLPDEGESVSALNRWHYMQTIVRDFWRKWSDDYLTQLRRRPKWKKLIANLKTGDVVILKDTNLPPCKWQLARITELYPGNDGLVRVVEVKTASGKYRRSISKLCPLLIDDT